MDFIDPSDNLEENTEITGWEPVLGGQLAEKAVWVDEAKCIGCQYCVHVASNTFMVDEFHGRSRALRSQLKDLFLKSHKCMPTIQLFQKLMRMDIKLLKKKIKMMDLSNWF